MRGLLQVLRVVVVGVALGTVETPVEVGLLVVVDVEHIKVAVFEGVVTGALGTDLRGGREPEGLDQLSRDEVDFSHAALLAAALEELAVVTPPSIVVGDVFVGTHADYGSSSSLVFLDLNVIDALVLELSRHFDQVQSELLREGQRSGVSLVYVELGILDHLVELPSLLIILLLGGLVKVSVLLELLVVVVAVLGQVETGLSLQIVIQGVLIASVTFKLLLDVFLLLLDLCLSLKLVEVLHLREEA